ncbi:MAG: GDP-mannose 4,6-dehydratase [Verrucomicrobiota bacterium]
MEEEPSNLKRALITGITGQDGYYLASRLLDLGYEVHGIVRQTNLEKSDDDGSEIYDRCTLHVVSLDSFHGLYRLISQYSFHECYHLGAVSFVSERLADGFHTIFSNTSGTHYLLTALHELQPDCRFYFAGSSEMFGRPKLAPQNEETPFLPRNPYGISKVTSYHLVRNYREEYGMHCVTGILYNHESPRRRQEFVTRKITRAVARIKAGLQEKLELGNLDAQRDWGYAPDYVRAMHLMLNASEAEDYVVSTGKLHTVREFCEVAFQHAGMDWEKHVVSVPKFFRKLEDVPLQGDPSRIRERLHWETTRGFKEIVCEMVDRDLATLAR